MNLDDSKSYNVKSKEIKRVTTPDGRSKTVTTRILSRPSTPPCERKPHKDDLDQQYSNMQLKAAGDITFIKPFNTE